MQAKVPNKKSAKKHFDDSSDSDVIQSKKKPVLSDSSDDVTPKVKDSKKNQKNKLDDTDSDVPKASKKSINNK